MNEILNSIFLSIVQGLTEFLPISSSGHLVLFEQNPWHPLKADNNLLMNVVLHFGTMIATIVVFRYDIWSVLKAVFSKRILEIRSMEDIRKDSNLWLLFVILIGTIPTGLIGLSFKGFFESLMEKREYFWVVAVSFMITGFILFSTRFIKSRLKNYEAKSEYNNISIVDSLIIGIVQGIAITPGISRSGTTISAGLWCNIKRDKVGHFSFLLSLPAIFGATILEVAKVIKINNFNNINYLALVVGFILSFVTGYIALKILLSFINRGKLHNFSYYCWFIGIISIVISIFFM